MSVKFVSVHNNMPPVEVEWTQSTDDGTWSKFVDFMQQEGYFIPQNKIPKEWYKATPSGFIKHRLNGPDFEDSEFANDIADVLKKHGYRPGNPPEDDVEKIKEMLEVIRGNRQA